MTQTERRTYLIEALLKEQPQFSKIEIPCDEQEQKTLLRSLFNIRMPEPVTEEFLAVQNAYLQEETRKKRNNGAFRFRACSKRDIPLAWRHYCFTM